MQGTTIKKIYLALDNYNKIVQNARYMHQDNVVFLVSK
jgi:hypothetical protein